MNSDRTPAWNPWLVALVVALFAIMLRWAMDPLLGNRVPFATFFIAIVFAIRYGNPWAALAVTLSGLVWAALRYFPTGPYESETIFSSVLYLFSALVIIALGQRMHEAETLAEGRARQLVDNVRILSASQGRLQLATEVSGTGVFQWDVRGDRFEGENPEAYRIFGRKPDMAKLTMAEFFERHVHPDDAANLRRELELAQRPGERLQVEFRYRRGVDGEVWRWLHVAGRFLVDEAGRPTQLIGVITDVTERREMEDDLRRMAADLSDADHRKDEFLATLAHELRNPLAPIRNGIELLKRGGGNPGTQGVVGVMERQMSHLVRLVDDLIDVSRITRNKLELRRHSVELANIVQAAVEACRPLLDAKGQLLAVSLPPTPVHVDADATRLVQVLSNLLNNASKYTDRGGHIGISLERRGQEALLSVGDDGSGIPSEMLPRVFEMFTQLDRDMERSQGGLGIGLSMVKRLVELHDGTVEIHSEGAGKGTRVEVRLPLVLTPMPQGVAAGTAGSKALPPRRILVADDNADAAESLAQVLRLMGNEVETVADGVEVLEQAPGFDPDIVMLDIGMPRLNGYEACRRLREREGGGELVIIAVTGWGQDEDRARSREAGFDLHLTKPVDPLGVEALLASLPAPRPR